MNQNLESFALVLMIQKKLSTFSAYKFFSKGATLNNSLKRVIFTILELRKYLKQIKKNRLIQN